MNTTKAMGTVLLLSLVTGCAFTSSDINYPPKSKHFIEQDEPTISIKPLPLAPQTHKENGAKPNLGIVPQPAPSAPSTQSGATARIQVIPLATKPEANVGAKVENQLREEEWSIKRSDRTLRGTLERWAREANARLSSPSEEKYKIVWDAPRKFDVSIEKTYTGSLRGAVEDMMQGLSITDYPVVACYYENRVFRIVRDGDEGVCKKN